MNYRDFNKKVVNVKYTYGIDISIEIKPLIKDLSDALVYKITAKDLAFDFYKADEVVRTFHSEHNLELSEALTKAIDELIDEIIKERRTKIWNGLV